MKKYFDHEKLNVYQKALEFVKMVNSIIENIDVKISSIKHLDEASTSIVLNIAEGNGKFTSKDRCKFFDIARGSALEFGGCLNVLFLKNKIKENELIESKELLSEIVSMLVGLIKSNSNRLYEKEEDYNAS